MHVVIRPEHVALTPGDERLEQHIQILLRELRTIAPLSQERKTDSGYKGGAAEIILALGTAGAIRAAVEVFRLWVQKDERRRIRIEAKVNGTANHWDISANGIPHQVIERALNKILKGETESS